ncbi:MAG: NFACT family protein, partial [Candidatus Njordarchaeota archaeon]
MFEDIFISFLKLSPEDSMTSPDIMRALIEFKNLSEGVIEKIYQHKRKFFFRIRTKKGRYFLLMEPAVRVNLTNINYEWELTNFIMMIRKHLKGKKIISVRQYMFDRIVLMELEDEYKVICEVIRRGNFVVTRG